ncbi:MAG: chorismate synthase [Candidatus Zixiibacteriota bacterium]|nr:MAG: chorismate synthase [candidate division Zixibacteria bacterium]
MVRYLSSGESHGPQLTVIVDGFPAGFRLDIDRINLQLRRRQTGFGRGGRMKIENDEVQVVSGLRSGVTLGSPITLVIYNRDWDNWREVMDPHEPSGGKTPRGASNTTEKLTGPRPGHADLPGSIKFGQKDIRNVLERASARETATRVAAGCLARQFLEYFGVGFASHVIRIGEVHLDDTYDTSDLEKFASKVEKSKVRCIDGQTGQGMVRAIESAGEKGDSLGGVVEIIVRGMPIGLGGFSQPDRRLDGRLAAAMMSIPSVKGVEFGLGFRLASLPGSLAHDEIFHDPGGRPAAKGFYRKTNRAGGIEGGMSNGEDIVIRLGAKPVSTLTRPLATVDVVTKQPATAIVERADICIVPVLGVIGEAAAAMVLVDAFFDKFGRDNLAEIEGNYQAFLKTAF